MKLKMHVHPDLWRNIAVMHKLHGHVNTFMFDIFFFTNSGSFYFLFPVN